MKLVFFQSLLSKKNSMPMGTKFLKKDENIIIILIACEGYPRVKFIYETGEDFDIAKNSESEFIPMVERLEKEEVSEYNEDSWNSLDVSVNGIEANEGKKALVIKDENRPVT